MKKKEVPVEVKPAEAPPEVRLEAVVEQPATPPVQPVVEAAPVVKPPEIGVSIDNLAKIVDSSSSVPQTPVETEVQVEKTDKKAYVWLAVSFLLGLGLGIGVGYLVWGRTVSKPVPTNTKVNEVIPTQVPQVTPTAAPAAVSPTPTSLQKSTLKIEVLNGTGGKGVAAKAKDVLTKAGYTTVTTGNADRDDIAQTEISLKASKNMFLDGLKKELSTQYTIAADAGVLAETSVFDAVITIGLK